VPEDVAPAPAKSRRERYSEATREALLDSAERLFLDRGFADTALADVAAAADVTRGAVYHHFADKHALFEAVMERREAAAVARVTRSIAAATSAWEAAVLGLDAFLDQCMDRDYGRIVWQLGPVALGFDRWRSCAEQYGLGLTRQLVAALLDDGTIAPAPVEPVTRIVFAALAECGLMLSEASDRDRRKVRKACAELLLRLVEGLRHEAQPPSARGRPSGR
jgi:AcrR family transcriptional regulator